MASLIELLVEAPRRSSATPSSSGDFYLSQESSHNLAQNESLNRTLVTDVKTGQDFEVSRNRSDQNFKWIEPTTNLIWQRQNGAYTELWMLSAPPVPGSNGYLLGRVDRKAKLLQAICLPGDDIGVLFHATDILGHDSAWPHSTGMTFNGLPCVTFDQGAGKSRSLLLFLRLSGLKASHKSSEDTQESEHAVSSLELIDVLAGSDLEFFPFSGSMPNISPPNCSLSSSGIAFMAVSGRAPEIDKFSCETYFVSLPQLGSSFAPPVHVSTEVCDGWCALPTFSKDGTSLAFVREESSKMMVVSRSMFVVRDVQHKMTSEFVKLIGDDGLASHLYPDSLQFGPTRDFLYFAAADVGRQKVFRITLNGQTSLPEQIGSKSPEQGSVTDYHVIVNTAGKELVFLTRSSFTRPSWSSILNVEGNMENEIPNQSTLDLALSRDQVSEAWYECEGRQIHTFVLRPSTFVPTKQYPVILLIHGGPMSAWLDSFFPRWSPILWAEQGFIVVMPNFTGSTGYSREFRAAVWGEFGGMPYRDLAACMDFIAETMPAADLQRAACVGGSYGGYMTLWIAGQPLAKRFKALVAHAPCVFGSTGVYASDVTGLWQNLFMGIHQNFDRGNLNEITDRWDPSRHAENWQTPILLSHGARDNRCPTSISLAAFTHCQMKRIESKLLVFPDESHFILQPGNWHHWFSEMVGWVTRYTH